MYPTKTISIGNEKIILSGLSDTDDYFLNMADDIDPEYNRLVEMNVSSSAVCVDIGANIGVKAVQLARKAPNGRVLAIEAAPAVFAVLKVNAAANDVPNLVIEQAAVTDHEGTVFFKDESAYGHIATHGTEVPATTLATLMHRHGLPRLDFLKIDVEGFEFPVLRSSLPLFIRFETVVCFEFNSWCMLAFSDDHPRKCLEWLLSTFAEVYVLRRNKPPEEALELMHPANPLGVLMINMFQDGHVSDIVACTVAGRVRY